MISSTRHYVETAYLFGSWLVLSISCALSLLTLIKQNARQHLHQAHIALRKQGHCWWAAEAASCYRTAEGRRLILIPLPLLGSGAAPPDRAHRHPQILPQLVGPSAIARDGNTSPFYREYINKLVSRVTRTIQ